VEYDKDSLPLDTLNPPEKGTILTHGLSPQEFRNLTVELSNYMGSEIGELVNKLHSLIKTKQ
jgi:hypothetical protein